MRTPRKTSSKGSSAHEREINRYIDDVLKGRVVAGKLEIAAVRRHLQDLKTGAKRGLYHDPVEAIRRIDFIQCLKHSTGEFDGKPFILNPFQKFIIWVLFGWKRKKDGTRRFREAYISMGRGNGKSPIVAAILLSMVCLDGEARAQIKIAATERGSQDGSGAMIVFNECANFIASAPALAKRFDVLSKSIVFKTNGSSIMPLGKDGKKKDGFILHAFAADELHEWQEEHRALWEKLETAMGKRRQPMALIITTAGSDRSKLWLEKYKEARQVVEGVYPDDAMFVAIFQIDDDDDPFDERNWRKPNPNLGVSVKLDYLRRLAEKAKRDATAKNTLLRYHMNVLVRSREKLIRLKVWDACQEPLPDLVGLACHGGLDLGWRDDLASAYLCFPLGDRRYALIGKNWICEETPHHDLLGEPWAHWRKLGQLIVTDGNVTDPQAILSQFITWQGQYHVRTVAADPNNARMMMVALAEICVPTFPFFQQARKYNEPIREFLNALDEGRIIHGGDPVLRFAANNLIVRSDSAGLWMPDKLKSDEKIDPMCGALMAFSECLFAERQAVPDVFFG